ILRIPRPPVVALADGSEELIRAERQRAHGIDLVNEDDEALRAHSARGKGQRVSLVFATLCPLLFALCEHAVLQRFMAALEGPGPVLVYPEVVQLVFQDAAAVQLPAQAPE